MKPLLTLTALLALAAGAAAQTAPTPLMKIKQLDLMNQLLPVLLTPAQIKAMLPAIEKAQEAERKLIKQEAEELKAIEGRVDKALAAAREKGEVPSRELQQDIHKMFADFRLRRVALTIDSADAVLAIVEKELDKGQLAVIANSIKPEELAPGRKPEDVTDQEKRRGWVRIVLLDPAAYDLLVEMSRKS